MRAKIIILRSVAGELAKKYDFIDYFPSYEMIASPWSKGFFYDANMRSVNPGGVASVMLITSLVTFGLTASVKQCCGNLASPYRLAFEKH